MLSGVMVSSAQEMCLYRLCDYGSTLRSLRWVVYYSVHFVRLKRVLFVFPNTKFNIYFLETRQK